MTKHTNEQEKIDAWMKKKDEWAQELISSCPEGANFATVVNKSRQMQSQITNIAKKINNEQEKLLSEYDFINESDKTIARNHCNCNRYLQKLITKISHCLEPINEGEPLRYYQ